MSLQKVVILTAFEVPLGVNAFPRPGRTAKDTTRSVTNRAVRIRCGQITLGMTFAGAGFVDATLPIALRVRPSANALDGEDDRERRVSEKMKSARSQSPMREVRNLTYPSVQVNPQGLKSSHLGVE